MKVLYKPQACLYIYIYIYTHTYKELNQTNLLNFLTTWYNMQNEILDACSTHILTMTNLSTITMIAINGNRLVSIGIDLYMYYICTIQVQTFAPCTCVFFSSCLIYEQSLLTWIKTQCCPSQKHHSLWVLNFSVQWRCILSICVHKSRGGTTILNMGS